MSTLIINFFLLTFGLIYKGKIEAKSVIFAKDSEINHELFPEHLQTSTEELSREIKEVFENLKDLYSKSKKQEIITIALLPNAEKLANKISKEELVFHISQLAEKAEKLAENTSRPPIHIINEFLINDLATPKDGYFATLFLSDVDDEVGADNIYGKMIETRIEKNIAKRFKRSNCAICERQMAHLCVQHCRGICNLWC